MNWKLYLGNLRLRHDKSLLETMGPARRDLILNLLLAGTGILVTLIVFATDGYRAGFVAIHSVGIEFSTRALELSTNCGDYLLAICLVALIARRQPRVLWMAVLSIVYAAALCQGLKIFVSAARPPAVLGSWLSVVGPLLRTHSFPSGHTATAFVTAACFSVGARDGVRVLLFALAAVVGISRVLVGVHWPLDVTAGAAVAGISVALAIGSMKYALWGLSLTVHLCVVGLIAAICIFELVSIPDYPLARPLSMAVAALALAVLARDYLIEPCKPGCAGALTDHNTAARSRASPSGRN